MIKKWLALGTVTFGIGFGLSLLVSRDVKRSVVSGAIAVPAALVGVAVLENGRKRSLKDEIADLEKRLNELNKEIAGLEKQIAEREKEKKELESTIPQLNGELEKLRSDKKAIELEIAELTAEKQKLSNDLTELQSRRENLIEAIGNLEARERELNERISDLKGQENALEENIDRLQRERQELVTAIATSRDELHGLNEAIDHLESRSNSLRERVTELEKQKDNLEEIQQQIYKLTENVDRLEIQKQGLQTTIDELEKKKQELEPKSFDPEPDLPSESDIDPIPDLIIISYPERDKVTPYYLQKLWEEGLYPFWYHSNRPSGRRFLGSVPVQQEESDKLYNILAFKLRNFEAVTYEALDGSLSSYFRGGKDDCWLNIFTFLMSEYAYFHSEENNKFWKGLCDKLQIKHSDNVEKELRKIAGEGMKKLGLIQTNNGFRFVSNLWLQSGIPVKNIGHFSQLVQEEADEYGWWEIAHSEPIDIAEQLLSSCQKRHKGWGTLKNFLSTSYSEEEKLEPITGELVQGIARIAYILEKENRPVHSIQDPHFIEQISREYVLPQSFFLRDWEQIIKILTPRKDPINTIVSRRVKSLFLFLDVAYTGNTELILPRQTFDRANLNKYKGSNCYIPEAEWIGEVSIDGKLEIPELSKKIHETDEIREFKLLDRNKKEIYKWPKQGIDNSLPCLIFDAARGTHLPVYLPNPRIVGIEEIICFYPKEITIEFSEEIETIDPYIPCSIQNWRGQQIRLFDRSASIDLTFPDDRPPQKIIWNRDSEYHPALVGTRLMNLKGIDIYLDPPTFWYPPSDRDFTINMVLDNLNERTTITRQTYPKQKSSEWYQIPLQEWIIKPDPAPPALRSRYQVYFEIDYQRWTYQFEIRREYRILETPAIVSPSIELRTGESIPYICNSSNQFWSKTITIKGLWVLEEIVFLLDNGKESIAYQVQADTSGEVIFNVAVLHDALSPSNYYRLEYQRLGLETRQLLEYRA